MGRSQFSTFARDLRDQVQSPDRLVAEVEIFASREDCPEDIRAQVDEVRASILPLEDRRDYYLQILEGAQEVH